MIQPNRPRRILVTGGASGIGLAVVRAFKDEGDFVVSLDLAESAAASESVIGDVRDFQSHEQAVAVASGEVGLDVLVVNAGIHDGGLGLHSDVDELSSGLRAVLEVDVVGYVLALRAAAADLKAST